MKRHFFLSLILTGLTLGLSAQSGDATLFYLSGESVNADIAKGTATPNFLDRVSVIGDGALGSGIRAHYRNTYAYLAPGNIYSERGTIAFNWRSGEEMTETEFPLWRVSFADHSSWDMVWLRIDWNGHGYDAFVTDNNLVRVRLSTTAPTPSPDEWIHIAFSWDEEKGVRLYLNGEKVAQRDTAVCLNTGLDQFGPHSRIISPYQVQSAYIVQRGGDIDEVRIYDHQLTDAQVALVAAHDYSAVPADDGSFHAAGWRRFLGFDKALPPYLENPVTAVRKIEITEAYDYKKWYWKACDGLRETTWPGVYNRSRIEGRSDYFQLPDWDCYSFSGTDVRFVIPEQWNYLEITGGAFGSMSGPGFSASKAQGTQKTFHSSSMHEPGEITFTNVIQETPIQEFNAFKVEKAGDIPAVLTLSYGLQDFEDFSNPMLTDIEGYIDGRFRAGERTKLLANTWAAARNAKLSEVKGGSPVAHIIIPSDCKELDINVPPVPAPIDETASEFGAGSTWNTNNNISSWRMLHVGLDGIRLSIPALDVAPMEGGLIPLNIAVMDPIDPLRYMMDFSFSVKPGEARTLWLDLRDRILPEDKPMYLRISSGCEDFTASNLQGTRIDLIFKDYQLAAAEHVTDRFNQVRDNYGTLAEEATASRRFLKFRRFENDLTDLLKVDPDHPQGLRYRQQYYPATTIVPYEEPVAPKGMPEWAFLQLRHIDRWKYLAQWYLDNRQAPNGEFGGGLSDDSDFTNIYVPLVEMDIMKEKSRDAVLRSLQAIYDDNMLTNGVSTIQTDGLHTFEEGENSTCQAAIVDRYNPLVKERLLRTAHGVREAYLDVNSKGHLHLKSDYMSATKAATAGRWVWNSMRGNFHLASPIVAAELYGDEFSKNYVLQYFNSLFEHARVAADGGITLPSEINFITDEDRIPTKYYGVMMAHLWKWTGDEKYLKAANVSVAPFVSLSEDQLVREYRQALRNNDYREYYNTYGAPYIDRVRNYFTSMNYVRLGGSCVTNYVPWNLIAWDFDKDDDAEKVAIKVDFNLQDDWFDVEFFNTTGRTVKARMIGRRAADGTWEMSDGRKSGEVSFGRDKEVEIRIPAGKSYTVKMRKK